MTLRFKPSFRERARRLFRLDTSGARFVAGLGALILGAGMCSGHGRDDPLTFFAGAVVDPLALGVAFLAVGVVGIWGTLARLRFSVRLALSVVAMWLWAFVALSKLTTPPETNTELLLVLPLVVEAWALIQTISAPRRRRGTNEH